jgi:hypothetical protein
VTGAPNPKLAGVPLNLDDDGASTPQFARAPGFLLVAPGRSIALGPISLGEDILGFDCVVDADAIAPQLWRVAAPGAIAH